jgi:hypothetical protein
MVGYQNKHTQALVTSCVTAEIIVAQIPTNYLIKNELPQKSHSRQTTQ